MLDVSVIEESLTRPGVWEIEVREEVHSTNDAVLAGGGLEPGRGRVLFAESQRAGRGRRGNVWSGGVPGSNLLFSCALCPPGAAEQWSRLTHVTAWALMRVLGDYPPARPLVKWPNDIYMDDRKVAGILVETVMRGGGNGVAVIGVGLNVNGSLEDYPPALRDTVTSLRLATGTLIDREVLAARFLDQLAEGLAHLPERFSMVVADLREAHYLLGRRVRLRMGQDSAEGLVLDLGAEGELVVDTGEAAPLRISSADEVRPIG